MHNSVVFGIFGAVWPPAQSIVERLYHPEKKHRLHHPSLPACAQPPTPRSPLMRVCLRGPPAPDLPQGWSRVAVSDARLSVGTFSRFIPGGAASALRSLPRCAPSPFAPARLSPTRRLTRVPLVPASRLLRIVLPWTSGYRDPCGRAISLLLGARLPAALRGPTRPSWEGAAAPHIALPCFSRPRTPTCQSDDSRSRRQDVVARRLFSEAAEVELLSLC